MKVATRKFPTDDHRVKQAIRNWGVAWQEAVRTEFLAAYRKATAGASFVPRSDQIFDRVLGAFELQKAIYEIGYEMDNRPDWLWVPLEGIISIRNRLT
jgi:maltose alpha-D-glucosyltransferase/alpha-amylase